MAVSRTMWLRGIQIDAAKMKMNARDDRADRIKEITQKWRDGFKALKEENDRLQVLNKDRYEDEIGQIDEMTRSQISKGPPTD